MTRKVQGNAGRSTTGDAAVPYYVESPAREAAKHLRLTAARFLTERASPRDLNEAIKIWLDAAKNPDPKKCDPDRALAAAEVLEAVWLSEKHFELEHKVDDPPVAEIDDEDHVWITVKIHVPALDVDMWIDGTHGDHPDNQDASDDDDNA
jgi:hypothetical protein